jgi:signal peptidase I
MRQLVRNNTNKLDMELEVTGSAETRTGATSSGNPGPRRDYLGLGRMIIQQFLSCMLVAAVAYGCFQFITHYVLQSVQIVGGSMSPTLHDSERYVLNRWVYHLREPQPKDIVVLRDPEDKCYAVKRIIAQQGDRIYVNKAGQIFVNGELLNEPYLPPGTMTFASAKVREQMWICGTNRYFVLGDNRNNSADSRIYGAVPRKDILGLVLP